MKLKGKDWLSGVIIYAAAWGAQAADLTLRIDQSSVDHVTNDMGYPYKIRLVDPPCDLSSFKKLGSGAGATMASGLLDAAHQKGNEKTEWGRQIIDWASAWSDEMKAIETNKATILKNNKPWRGPSDAEIGAAKQFKLPVTACVTNERVTIDQKPSVNVSPPGVLVGIPSISAHADVQVFIWNPFHHCNAQVCIGNLCVCYSWDPGWDPLGGGFDLGTDHATATGKLSARAATAEVFLDPTIDSLRFAPPWDWIPLEKLINGSIPPLKILDVGTITISLGVLGLAYVGQSVTVTSGTGYLEAAGIFHKQ